MSSKPESKHRRCREWSNWIFGYRCERPRRHAGQHSVVIAEFFETVRGHQVKTGDRKILWGDK